ncbi:MAG: hypothetical protein RSC33_05815, partial [Vagococcus sp.]
MEEIMKKLKYLSLTVSAFLLMAAGIATTEAKTFNMNDIDEAAKVVIGGETVYDNVYIVGTHMFTNVITLDDIMTGARTLQPGAENIIFYRANDKTWSNALGGGALVVPDTFEIKVSNRVSVEDAVLAANLEKLILEAKALVTSEYTPSSFAAVTDALKLAQDTDDLKKTKLDAITLAMSNLSLANIDALNKLVAECDALVKADYTLDTYNAFKAAYDSIKTMKETTFNDVKAKLDIITSLKSKLVKSALNKDNLKSVIDAEYTGGNQSGNLILTEAEYVST